MRARTSTVYYLKQCTKQKVIKIYLSCKVLITFKCFFLPSIPLNDSLKFQRLSVILNFGFSKCIYIIIASGKGVAQAGVGSKLWAHILSGIVFLIWRVKLAYIYVWLKTWVVECNQVNNMSGGIGQKNWYWSW